MARVALTIAVCAGATLSGCAPYTHAEVSALRPAQAPRAGRVFIQSSVVCRARLDDSIGTGRSSLGLLHAALDLAGASGRPRLARDALAHFSVAATDDSWAVADGGIAVDIARADGLGHERWIVDPAWMLRRLRGGGLIARQGDFADVVAALQLMLPAP
jgi:hypothetical protein